MRCLHGGNRGFSRVHSLRKTGVLFNRRGSTCRATWSVTWTRYYGSRVARRELSRPGYVKIIAIFASEREAEAALHNPPEYDGPWWHALGERCREISTYVHGAARYARPFSRYSRRPGVIRSNRRCNPSNTANYHRLHWLAAHRIALRQPDKRILDKKTREDASKEIHYMIRSNRTKYINCIYYLL